MLICDISYYITKHISYNIISNHIKTYHNIIYFKTLYIFEIVLKLEDIKN